MNISKENNVHLPQNINDLLVCKGEVVHVNATTPFAEHYLWSTGNQQPVQTIKIAGTYQVTATNSCSSDEKIFTITYKACNCKVYIPTAFTPNRDGLNDVFHPIVKCYPSSYFFSVYDNFGNMIYNTSEIGKGWDGKIKEYDAPAGVYIWLLKYKNSNDYSTEQKKGTVTLIR